MASEIRIVIADDHPVVRKGLRQTIESDPAFQVVAEVGDGDAALAEIESLQPDIAVLDVDMPKLDGLGVAQEVARRKLPVAILFLTFHAEEDLFHAAMDLGSKGYLLKESALLEIVLALKSVAFGQYYVSPALTSHLLDRRSRTRSLAEKHPGLTNLTRAERRVLRGISEGKSSKEIGAELSVHFRTVENHRTNICQKLGLHGHNSLFKFAMQHKDGL